MLGFPTFKGFCKHLSFVASSHVSGLNNTLWWLHDSDWSNNVNINLVL